MSAISLGDRLPDRGNAHSQPGRYFGVLDHRLVEDLSWRWVFYFKRPADQRPRQHRDRTRQQGNRPG
jgi:hypothetical protein